MSKVIIGHSAKGIKKTELEYLRDENDEIRYFDGVEAAKLFLLDSGVKNEELKHIVFRTSCGTCLRCGSPLFKSDIDGYVYQCFCCDEDYYGIEQGGYPQTLDQQGKQLSEN